MRYILSQLCQGPFRLGQSVEFSCFIEPDPGNVTYRWINTENYFGSNRYSSQNISTYYSLYDGVYHYCWYFCQVFLNQTVIGSSSRIIEVQDEQLIRCFNRGERLELNVNLSNSYFAQHISSLAWYHNGTKITPNNKFITNGTMLRILNMNESDAGIYEVKINSINFYGDESSPECNSRLLPLLESLAIHAPVSFIVREYSSPAPIRDLQEIISNYYITDYNDGIPRDIVLSSTQLLNISVGQLYNRWYKDGSSITDGDMFNSTITHQEGLVSNTLHIMYNNTNDVTGNYVGSSTFYIHDSISTTCRVYYYYLSYFGFNEIPFGVTYTSIKVYKPPSSVHVNFGTSTLALWESTTLECTAVGGKLKEAFNMTLWKNNELLAFYQGDSLRYYIKPPHEYGSYRCAVNDIVHNTSLLYEKAYFQLLLDNVYLSQCEQLNEDLITAVSTLLREMCPECDVYPYNFKDATLNCSTSGTLAYFTAALVYSNPEGTTTASTRINMLLVWLLSQDSPVITVDNTTTLSLNQRCPTQLNAVTSESCIKLFNSGPPPQMVSVGIDVPITIGVFFAGIITGTIISITVVLLIICIKKFKTCRSFEFPVERDKEMTMDANQAYETVDVRYEAGRLGQMEGNDEPIYEHPAI